MNSFLPDIFFKSTPGPVAPVSPRAEALLQHWHECRGDRLVPTRREFSPHNLLPWLGSLTILNAIDNGRDFVIKLDGTDVVALTGQDWTGRLVSEIDAEFESHIGEVLREVMTTAIPQIKRIHILQKSWQSATRVCLPVSSGDGQVADQLFKAIFLDH